MKSEEGIDGIANGLAGMKIGLQRNHHLSTDAAAKAPSSPIPAPATASIARPFLNINGKEKENTPPPPRGSNASLLMGSDELATTLIFEPSAAENEAQTVRQVRKWKLLKHLAPPTLALGHPPTPPTSPSTSNEGFNLLLGAFKTPPIAHRHMRSSTGQYLQGPPTPRRVHSDEDNNIITTPKNIPGLPCLSTQEAITPGEGRDNSSLPLRRHSLKIRRRPIASRPPPLHKKVCRDDNEWTALKADTF